MELSRYQHSAGFCELTINVGSDYRDHIPAIIKLFETDRNSIITVKITSAVVQNELNQLAVVNKVTQGVITIVLSNCYVDIDQYKFPIGYSLIIDNMCTIGNMDAIYCNANKTFIMLTKPVSVYPDNKRGTNGCLKILPDVDNMVPEQFYCEGFPELVHVLAFSKKLAPVFGNAFDEWSIDTRVEYLVQYLTDDIYHEKIVPVLGQNVIVNHCNFWNSRSRAWFGLQ